MNKSVSQTTLFVNDIPVTVKRKRIKNLYLRVRGSSGEVEVSAPSRCSLDELERWLFDRQDWLIKQRERAALQPVLPEYKFVSGEQHKCWGENCTLNVVVKKRGTSVERFHNQLTLTSLPHYNDIQRKQVLNRWYRQQISQEVETLLEVWQPRMGAYSSGFGIKAMKTRWGSCNIRSKKIWLNLELVKKPPQCLEYVVVHELVHLFERYHNARFYALMDRFLPDWRERKKLTNQLI
ncbi:SprT family zinc-dependent metalloprotease [Idiomarina sp. HP20-50]|uniref:M48 family metallopeptidase n=1 Tax=Idiomarina sp. HP20-50 TaxID=3070813 RepID=UPI00294B3F8A|nr:SprT family zinc-dependent metalloprotease [Idiomarina sp. HP20-50]MDV6314975.1 SprT family zinc-dependent metalloprotease [Idiomarina sp. HP20-50]